jgi:peptidoglycan-N-acetylglucosamine deacetylase
VKYFYSPPFIVKKLFPELYWNTTNDKILLTFDDGPNPDTTERILYTLNQLKIKSLFFCVGNNIKNHFALTKSILSEGHTIGNHTYNHKILSRLKLGESINEIQTFNTLLQSDHNFDVKFLRPPHGRINLRTKKLLNETGMKCIMWNLLTYDYQNNFEKVKYSVNNFLQQNSIIVLHDSNKSKDIIKDSIKYIFNHADKKGYQFGEPNECLR